MSEKGFFRRLWDRSIKAAQAVVQAVFLPAGLFVLYFAGLGITWVFAKLLRVQMLQDPDPSAKTFWTPAEGFEPDLEDCTRQS
jgi:hypothetical protein